MTSYSVRKFTSFVEGAGIAESGQEVDLIDPATGSVWAKSFVDPDAVNAATASARAAFEREEWQVLAPAERAAKLRKLGDLVEANALRLGRLESLANGKTHGATEAEMKATAQWYRYFASALETHDQVLRTVTATLDAHIVREPLGVVVAVTPFNGALSLGSWKLAPALAMGNVVILKPPAEAPGSSIALAELAIEAGFPKGTVNVVIGDAGVSELLACHRDVQMVSFTGSTAVARVLGSKVTALMKKFVCEAGGKSAHLVFGDADLEGAVIAATQGAFSATGQTCVAGSRVLVQSDVFDEFIQRYVESVKRIRVGDPAAPATHLGPLASKRQYDKVREYIELAKAEGGRVLVDGTRPEVGSEFAGGFWVGPTVIVDVTPEMRVCREEIFGPVVIVQKFDDEDDAITLANGLEYGLAAGFWTRDYQRIRRVSRRLQAGTVWVNTYRAINQRVPFGGYKQSGLGRENGVEAMHEFSQIKSIVVEHGPVADPFST